MSSPPEPPPASRHLAYALAVVPCALLIAVVGYLSVSGSRWSQLETVYASLEVGADLEESTAQIDMHERRVTRADPEWEQLTRWVLSEEERRRVTTVLFYEEDGGYGPAPSQCALYFDAEGRLVKKVLDP